MKIIFDKQSIEINPSGDDYVASVNGKTVLVQVIRAEYGRMDLLIDGERVTAYVSSDMAKRWVTINGQHHDAHENIGGQTRRQTRSCRGINRPDAGSGAKRLCQCGRCR